jgi:hypothetical protein
LSTNNEKVGGSDEEQTPSAGSNTPSLLKKGEDYSSGTFVTLDLPCLRAGYDQVDFDQLSREVELVSEADILASITPRCIIESSYAMQAHIKYVLACNVRTSLNRGNL